jgi:hypothetical protein
MLYSQRDIEVDDGGEIQFDGAGDLKVASAKRSHLQALHWLLASNRGDVLLGDTVADLGAWFGRLNVERNHRAMERNISRAIFEQRIFGPGDVQVRVVPVGPNEAAVTARLYGSYIEPVELADDAWDTFLGYVFTFGTGQLQPVS